MLSKQETLGNSSLYTTLVMPRNLANKEDINIKTKSDKYPCDITGCAVLSSNKLVLADNNNNKLKVLDTHSKLVVEEKGLDSSPFDITTLPQDQIAVTLPDKEEIHIMTSGNKLSTVLTIPVKGQCNGITYHQDHLYVVCYKPTSVVILDTKGNVHYTISLNDKIFQDPSYIDVSEESGLIFISGNDCIASITLQGEISKVYKDLPGPYGMVMFDNGSLLVCCENNAICYISGDLKQYQVMTDGLQYPLSICYNHHQNEVYIGGWRYDQLKVLSLK